MTWNYKYWSGLITLFISDQKTFLQLTHFTKFVTKRYAKAFCLANFVPVNCHIVFDFLLWQYFLSLSFRKLIYLFLTLLWLMALFGLSGLPRDSEHLTSLLTTGLIFVISWRFAAIFYLDYTKCTLFILYFINLYFLLIII